MTLRRWRHPEHSASCALGSASLALSDQRKAGRPAEAAFGASLAKAEPHRQAVAVVAALVMHAAGKAAHQMDAEIAGLCLRERRRNGPPRSAGWIECAAVILDEG